LNPPWAKAPQNPPIHIHTRFIVAGPLRFGDGGFMTEIQTLSRQLADDLSQGGPAQLLDRLIDHFRAEQQPHALFDALLMRARLQLGVPLVMQHSIDQLPEPQRSQLEDAYLAICREIGLDLLQSGRVGEAWPYLRPLGDREFLAAELAKVEPTEENQQVLIEILLHEGIDVARGYHLVIENFGTCNAISAFDGVVVAKPLADQQAAAALLVQQVYCELQENVRAHIARWNPTCVRAMPTTSTPRIWRRHCGLREFWNSPSRSTKRGNWPSTAASCRRCFICKTNRRLIRCTNDTRYSLPHNWASAWTKLLLRLAKKRGRPMCITRGHYRPKYTWCY
jgi:hypothetical protein